MGAWIRPYAYASEDYSWWALELGRGLPPGTFGDNITTSGIDLTNAVVGERWRAGTALMEVAQPRMPCFKLSIRMDDRGFPRRFSKAGRPGAYLRIIEPGEVGAGDPIVVISTPDHGLSVGEVALIYFADQSRADELLVAPQLPQSWKQWALQRSGSAARG